MKIGDRDYSITELFNLVRAGTRWQKDALVQKNDRFAICRKWLEDNTIIPGPFKVKAIACHGHYIIWCDQNKIEPSIRVNVRDLAKFLGQKFSHKQHGSTRLYEINKDLSQYEKKETE